MQEELREITEEYISTNHPEFFGKYTKKRWMSYYEKNIYHAVSLHTCTNLIELLYNFNFFDFY